MAMATATAAAVAIAGCGGESGSTPAQLEKKSIPAAVVTSPQSFIGTESLGQINNAWRTSDAKTFTQVEAGSVPGGDSVGVLAVFRHSFKNATQDADLVKVVGAGALKITKAPTGLHVESTAQRRGKIEFSSENGARGTLELRNDSVHLDPTPWTPRG